jgi:hypothetical protein
VDVTCELCELCKVRRLVLACADLRAEASCSDRKIYINSNLRSDKIFAGQPCRLIYSLDRTEFCLLDTVDLLLGG